MSAIHPRYEQGPITRAVSAAVAGGQVVSADQTATTKATVKPAAAGDKIVMGVALIDAAPDGTDSATDLGARPPNTTVSRGGVYPVTYSGAAKYGDLLKAANGGKVAKWVSGTDDPELIIGRSEAAGGSVIDGAVELAHIF